MVVGVIAVTGVDRRNRALIEAGRALHLDYSAPGDRVYALDARGRTKSWRGTSFATPLVAARIAAALERGANWRRIIDAEARDLGAATLAIESDPDARPFYERVGAVVTGSVPSGSIPGRRLPLLTLDLHRTPG